MESTINGHVQAPKMKRPDLPTRLTGTLRQVDGLDFDTAQFQLDLEEDTSAEPPEHGSAGTHGARQNTLLSRRSSSGDDDVEDYDTLKPEAGTIFRSKSRDEPEGQHKDATGNASEHTDQQSPSIPVRLSQIGRSGTYQLIADDPDLRQILHLGLERKKQNELSSDKRSMTRDLVFTRQFTVFDRQNPMGGASPFHGFYTLFWMGLTFLLIRVTAWNYRNYGNILGRNEIWHIMMNDLMSLALTDGVMVGSTGFGLMFQRLVSKGYFHWETSGWILQNIWQTLFLGTILSWSYYRSWQWPQTVFIFMHVLVFLMKQHSYAFYNGHLSMVYRRRQLLQGKLQRLRDKRPNALSHSSEYMEHPPDSPRQSGETETVRLRRKARQSVNNDLTRERSNVASAAETIESAETLNTHDVGMIYDVLQTEIDALSLQLQGKCSATTQYYPSNLTVKNFAEWTLFPTLVYELEYPRQDNINWWYVAEKTVAFFGGLLIMLVISQAYMYPPITAAVRMKEQGMSFAQRSAEFPWVALDLLLPLLLEQLLSWYVIWECLLNIFAELTRFADRGFYGDWWNCVSWDQWARDWNRPVHNFLLRHVYHSSISTFHVSKKSATLITFALSACIHELFMLCIFNKLRGYLFALQLAQVPLVALSRSKLLKGHNVLGNIIFWFGLFWGPSLITTLYLVM